MKFTFLLGLLLLSVLFATAQQSYVSKKQIEIGSNENGTISIKSTNATFIIKTDFSFKSIIGTHCTLNLITEDSKVMQHHLTLKSVKKNRAEKIYQFEVEESSNDYPKSFLQISVQPNTNFDIAVVIQNDVGKFTFYCNKL